jgi:flagellar basal-body rod protein FlgB
MDLNKVSLFGMMKQRLAWLGQRQEVLAQNIANADTPGYRPRDIKPLEFRGMVDRQLSPVNMEKTHGNHLAGRRASAERFDDQVTRRPYETAPAGNAVVLEEQMAKVSETSVAHRLTTELYRKHLGMIRTAIGGRR